MAKVPDEVLEEFDRWLDDYSTQWEEELREELAATPEREEGNDLPTTE